MIEHIRVSPDSTFDPKNLSEQSQKAFWKGVRKVADDIRDELRDEYAKVIHKTEYGPRSQVPPTSNASLGKSALVVRQQGQDFYIGPKLGGIKGSKDVQSYDEIFGYITEGTGNGRDGWWFKLPTAGGRNRATESGYWYTRGQEAKPFIDTVFENNESREFTIKVDKYVRLPIYKELGI